MATERKAITVYLDSLLQDYLQEYCLAYNTVGKDKHGQTVPRWGTGVVELLNLLSSIPVQDLSDKFNTHSPLPVMVSHGDEALSKRVNELEVRLSELETFVNKANKAGKANKANKANKAGKANKANKANESNVNYITNKVNKSKVSNEESITPKKELDGNGSNVKSITNQNESSNVSNGESITNQNQHGNESNEESITIKNEHSNESNEESITIKNESSNDGNEDSTTNQNESSNVSYEESITNQNESSNDGNGELITVKGKTIEEKPFENRSKFEKDNDSGTKQGKSSQTPLNDVISSEEDNIESIANDTPSKQFNLLPKNQKGTDNKKIIKHNNENDLINSVKPEHKEKAISFISAFKEAYTESQGKVKGIFIKVSDTLNQQGITNKSDLKWNNNNARDFFRNKGIIVRAKDLVRILNLDKYNVNY